MFLYSLKKISHFLIVLVCLVSLVFFLQRILPGDPADTILGDVPEEAKWEWREQFHLNDPIAQQYARYLKGAASLDFGKTYGSGEAVFSKLQARVPTTIKLALLAFSLSLCLAIFFGSLGAYFVNRAFDKFVMFYTSSMAFLPTFVLGPLLLWIFAIKYPIFPLFGVSSSFLSYVLPAVSLAFPLSGLTTRMVRSGLLDALREDYIRTAYSKGLSKKRILFKHALRNACIPVITILGLQLGVLLSGTLITENIFNLNGMGTLIVESVQTREYNTVGSCVILISAIYVFCNLVVDILYRLFDPRVQL